MPDPYLRDDFDPAQNASHRSNTYSGSNGTSAPQQPYRDSTGYYEQTNNYAQPGNYAQPAGYSYAARPSVAPMVVLAVINMLCCAFGVGFILGLAALVLALIAANEDNIAVAAERLKAAKVVNIVGVVLSALQIILIIISLIFFVSVGSLTRRSYYESEYPFNREYNNSEDFFDDFDDYFNDFEIN